MERICRTCKHCINGKCYNKDNKMGLNISGDIYNIFEGGYLSDFLRENIDVNDIVDFLDEELREQSIIRKNKKLDKDFSNDLEIYIIESLDNVISGFLISQIKDIEIEKEVESDFGCKFWE